MKQRITQEQWDELTEDERVFFADWFLEHYSPKEYPTTLATVGQLAYFLNDQVEREGDWRYGTHQGRAYVAFYEDEIQGMTQSDKTRYEHKTAELVDALWMATKDVLREKV